MSSSGSPDRHPRAGPRQEPFAAVRPDGPLVVLGDVLTDVTVRLPHSPRAETDTEARITWQTGGAGANVARWLAWLGDESVHLIARVGADERGRGLRTSLRRAGVRPWLAEDAVRTTGTCVVLVEPTGARTMLPDRGAALALAAADLPAAVFAPGGHLHVSGYALVHPGPRAGASAALARARAVGMTTSMDPGSAGPLADMGTDRFLDLAGPVDLWLPNLDEARLLSGGATAEEAARRLATGTTGASGCAVVVTCGDEGLVWSDGRTVVRVPSVPADVVDTTGAGDAATAGCLRAWRAGAGVEEVLRAAAQAAAVAVGRHGAGPPGPAA